MEGSEKLQIIHPFKANEISHYFRAPISCYIVLSIGPVYFSLKGCWLVLFIFIQILIEHSVNIKWRP